MPNMESIISMVGIEFLSKTSEENHDKEISSQEALEEKIQPDYDHITLI